MSDCQVCGHTSHGSTACKKKVIKDGKPGVCGCKSHSSKFDKGQGYNPGSGKRARKQEEMKSGKSK